ncbi:hypothetical protein [Flavobacterium muglaense]|uniref:Uncharacterized protein n=1 Tax=Flavobacterium muglaense TaxID=2764716 RepID=A0A923SH28_9FLAO|nr:hypothetical protein [Flavobacterium muglaense]MBC5838777.1 hypothetical protein [Flavobacterium muglaense]MBC5845264.1 hypothetical protein [Flavobacterium muglaense]
MKIFKYRTHYGGQGDVTGTIEHLDDLTTSDKERFVKQLIANKHGLDVSKMQSTCFVTRDRDAEKGFSSNGTNNTNSNQVSNSGSGLGNLAEGIGSGVGSLAGLAGKGVGSFFDMVEKDKENDRRRLQEVIDKGSEISEIEFGTTANEIQSQLEQLIAYSNSLTEKQYPIKKAVYSKVTFGIMRLRSLGATDNAIFFETESKKIKPNLWNAFMFFASGGSTGR